MSGFECRVYQPSQSCFDSGGLLRESALRIERFVIYLQSAFSRFSVRRSGISACIARRPVQYP
jgi:hypothetical protein